MAKRNITQFYLTIQELHTHRDDYSIKVQADNEELAILLSVANAEDIKGAKVNIGDINCKYPSECCNGKYHKTQLMSSMCCKY